jgi:hypothetical protein
MMRELLQRCRPTSDGFCAMSEDNEWRLGAILFAKSPAGFVLVQKAPVSGYEFSGLWSLPGGMVRNNSEAGTGSVSVNSLALSSLMVRAEREAGLSKELISDLKPCPYIGPVVTSYSAKGETRYTLIATFMVETYDSPSLAVSDHSVSDAKWEQAPIFWDEITPANRLILAHLRWSDLSETERSEAMPSLQQAFHFCSHAAELSGLPAPILPSQSAANVAEWLASWNEIRS